MSIIRKVYSLAASALTGLIAREVRRELQSLRAMEESLGQDLARSLLLPPSSVVVSMYPVPKVELKVPASPAQLLEVQRFLDRISGAPQVNGKIPSGLN